MREICKSGSVGARAGQPPGRPGQVEARHDASIGVNWDTLECLAEDLYGPAPETDAQEEQP
jgi:hypothetical protein